MMEAFLDQGIKQNRGDMKGENGDWGGREDEYAASRECITGI